ncbi:isoleucine--tRNA ligase [Moraxella nasicaprae]|uniref:Isoleucine--tRNA ligase n=1 Tax=Moraxella nasicaprae TaxID=2904122 RepID=A0ABY6F580_9GAMM|nr:isoleucine--tRNA ligase [Moraxella nasicaprae]UXZ05246.1 isoleucine--tRNA ligase [Moraxella nasicaprae]
MSQATDYKNTLNLADTAFPMRGDLAKREPAWLEQWQKDDVYGQIRQARQGQKKYTLHDGPPYANGQIHLGHVVNKVLKDIIIKYKTLDGYDAPYVPGWDCHGLPIEQKVEGILGKVGQEKDGRIISATEFRKACRDYAKSQIELQKADFKRLGVLGDWENPYLTMNFGQEADTVRALAKIYDNGHITRGMKPVNWCLDCGSALAEAEVEYEDKTSDAIYVGFDIVNRESLAHTAHLDGKLQAVIWTTTPWTLPANQAISVHSELDYVIVKSEKGYFIIAESLKDDFAKNTHLENYELIATIKGNEFTALNAQHPLIAERQVPIITGEHVTADSGTGLVHTAPAHGVDDYNVGKLYNLPTENPVGGNGVYLPEAKVFVGEHIYKAQPKIIETLQASGHLLAHNKIRHSYPHCWRHKTPIIFRATPQWFISMETQGLREQALADISKVTWTPAWGQNRIESMMNGRPDWCISRQRTWGVPITFFIHKDSGELHPRTSELMEQAAKLIEQGGVEAWFDADASQFIGDDANDYQKCTDTLDVWFDSGATNFAVLGSRAELDSPADLYLEGSDQHRGWFQSSLLVAESVYGRPPYKQVLTHGFTVDAKGYKLSKSKGNTKGFEPAELANKYGIDIVRLWVASSDYRYEMAVSKEGFDRVSDMYRRIRNTLRFLLANTDDFDPQKDMVADDELVSLDKFILNRTKTVQDSIIAAYNEMDFHQVCQAVMDYCSQDLGGFYLDIIKDRTYTTKSDGQPRRSAQTAIYHIAHALLRWIAPILSFTAQEAWQVLKGTDGYIFTQEWYKLPVISDAITVEDWHTIITIKDTVNKSIEEARTAKVVSSNLTAKVVITAPKELADILGKLGDELRFVFISSQTIVQAGTEFVVDISPADGEKCVRCWHILPTVGSHTEHPELCPRCVENAFGHGERRQFA